MKKVFGIIGSPRRNGNTDILVNRILEGARSVGAETEFVHLDELVIEQCDGCHRCWKEKRCRWQDDMVEIYDKISESDVIVLGTPVYWFGPSAMMKGCIDRFVFFNSPETRPMVRGKHVILAVPFEDGDLGTADPLMDMFERSLSYLEMDLFATLLVPGVTRKGEVRDKQGQMDRAYEIGRDSVSDQVQSHRSR